MAPVTPGLSAAPRRERPTVVLSMWPDILPDVFPAPLLEELSRHADVLSTRAVSELDADGLAQLERADVLITSWGGVTIDAETLRHAPRLKAIIHAAGSVKGHLTPDVWDAGVLVSSAVEIGAIPVIEYTRAMVFLASHRVISLAGSYRSGTFVPVGGRQGKVGLRVGVVGASRIGAAVIRSLVAEGWTVSAYDPVVGDERLRELGATPLPLDELCRSSDILTLHAPSIPETDRMIDARRLAMLPDGATVINSARGSLIDHDALEAECASGRIDAILDVTEPEPLPAGSGLLQLSNVFVSPHAAGIQGSERALLGAFAIEELRRYLDGEPLLGLVRQEVLGTIA
ncbi:hydroxyacid dehydrogenase [Antiquaquibacter soli]|uniref:Hydroxyacid dehydrogenase n=1 Tax=Antiquaquibacter soli TaxID=3064523 RepID=A0ABT9BNL8_9MICO|nr:hydroxyacid dehydrogenase [Protaetiibacter sp. WY-16]MDO7882634.1 hydroxyacid dehydrogenase [Protaetiibacter sp. WY-16]